LLIEHRRRDGAGEPETFDFLGFTYICGSIHKTGRFTVMRKTIGKRMAAKQKAIKAELRKRMHESIHGTGGTMSFVAGGRLYGGGGNASSVVKYLTRSSLSISRLL
jgi:hypothetical protein